MSSDLMPCVPSSNKLASPLKGEEIVEESSSSSSSSVDQEMVVKAKIEGEDHRHHQVKGSTIDGNGGEEEDGYHTPTSPSHRIPVAIECPPAPRKPSYIPPRFKKRRARCLLELKDAELVFSESNRSRKKARAEVASIE